MQRLVARGTLAAIVLAGPAWAGRPLTTEDASVLEAGRCQVEAWVDRSRETSTTWLVPACDFGADIEWQAGFARPRDHYVQAKTVFMHLGESQHWALGAVLGAARSNPYVTIPLSFAVGDGLVHVNAGWFRDKADRRDLTTWGLAGEMPFGQRFTGVAEMFGENRDKPFLRIGGKWHAIPGKPDVDLTWVARPGGTREERFVSIGVFWQSEKFLR